MSKVTIKDVAAAAGVSYQTVSKVLNKQATVSAETEARIWEAARQLHYRPNISARNLRTQSSNLIGYTWQRAADESPRPIIDQFLYNAVLRFEQAGYHVLTLLMGSGDEMDVTIYRELYGRRQVEGFILADTNQDDPRIAYLIEQGIPFASFGQANDAWDFCWVDVDGSYGMRLVVEHLLAQGHRRIGLITWPEGSEAGAHREAGYEEGLAAAGIVLNPDWVVRGENTVQTGAEGTARLLDLPAAERPTAVMCISDFIAIGALNTARAAGLQPGPDLAITGYDDLPMSQFFHPPLTTVHQPIAEVSRQLAELLLKQINGEPIAEKGILLHPRLVVRESSRS